VPIAAAVGATDAQIATATTVGAAGDGLDGPVLRLVDELAADGRGRPETVDELLAALGNRGLIELLLVIGQYRGLAALMNTVEIDFDQEAGVAVLESASTPRKPR
jgi:hypothetical protein